jgi:hypothetical protein
MAFLSEIHYQNTYAASSGNPEFIEATLSAAESVNAGNYRLVTYQTDGTVRASFALNDPAVTETIDPVTGYHVYTIDTVVTDPNHLVGTNEAEAVAFVDTSLPFPDSVIKFVDIGGGISNITAIEGPANGATSTNIPPSPTGESIKWDIFGNRITGGFTETTSITCFVADTLMRADDGEVKVQDLRAGDLLMTKDNGPQPIEWIWAARQSVEALQANPRLVPVKISQGALGNDLPLRDLMVSRQHRILVNGKIAQRMFGEAEILVPAKDLLEAKGINAADITGPVTYYHILLKNHEILLAEGLETESLYLGAEAENAIEPDARQELELIFGAGWEEFISTLRPARNFAKGKRVRALVQRHLKNDRPLFQELGGIEGASS